MLDALKGMSLPLKKYRVFPLDITNPQVVHDHPGSTVDTITCINVLEHIEKDVKALKHMKHFLKKGGKVVIFVPALQGIYGTLGPPCRPSPSLYKKDIGSRDAGSRFHRQGRVLYEHVRHPDLVFGRARIKAKRIP
jgi:SAM-dependent methyltransferase